MQPANNNTSLRFSARLLLVSLAAVLCWAMSHHNCGVEALRHLAQHSWQGKATIDSIQDTAPAAPEQPFSSPPSNVLEIQNEGEAPAPVPENDDDDQEKEEEEENQREREEERHQRQLLAHAPRKIGVFIRPVTHLHELRQMPTQVRAYVRMQRCAQWSINVERYALYHQWRLHAELPAFC